MNAIDSWRRDRPRDFRNRAGGELIPTWQTGREQPRPHDLRNFAEEGYSKNSLIYACVRERATAFASLGPPQVIRAAGEVAEPEALVSRMVELLADPNPYEDGAEFAELLETQYASAGNAYIHKVRESSTPARRREWSGMPVQELSLIRPDYVTIAPGETREEDMFLVTIGGVVRMRIPRRDMIHVHEPNLINDFYGLSKIALLVREGSIDLEMSSYILAFFRNAGVPMGILTVKSSTSPEQVTEIKSTFRRAYNGVRSWFDLLVLNQEEAKYEQIASKQKDMEMSDTRALVESRICSVMGVPPIIVGAKFAVVSGGQTGNYESAQFGFWSETMVPESERFARAFTKHLLPEFATTRDRGAKVAYDYTKVRVLQEDLSRKLREVVRMINTGGVTVQAAFERVGLTPPALPGNRDSHFYVRSANQAEVRIKEDGTVEIVQVEQPAGGSQKEPRNPLEGAARLAIEEIEERARG